MYLNSVFGNVKVKIVLQTCMTDEISFLNYLLTIWSNDEKVQWAFTVLTYFVATKTSGESA